MPPGANANQGKKQERGLNENYGRELMELHTLGVDGGYSQQDVIEVARAFTGWSIRQPQSDPEFFFDEQLHDSDPKMVLGHKIDAGGGRTAKRCWTCSRATPTRPVIFRSKSRGTSSPIIPRTRWWSAWRRRTKAPTAISAPCCTR